MFLNFKKYCCILSEAALSLRLTLGAALQGLSPHFRIRKRGTAGPAALPAGALGSGSVRRSAHSPTDIPGSLKHTSKPWEGKRQRPFLFAVFLKEVGEAREEIHWRDARGTRRPVKQERSSAGPPAPGPAARALRGARGHEQAEDGMAFLQEVI